MHEGLINRVGGLSLPRKSVVRFTDRSDMTLDVYRGRNTTTTTIVILKQFYIISESIEFLLTSCKPCLFSLRSKFCAMMFLVNYHAVTSFLAAAVATAYSPVHALCTKPRI